MRTVLTAAIAAMAMLPTWALPPPFEYTAQRVATARSAPTIDGVADEPVWAAAPWTEDFVDITGDAAKAPIYRTRAKMLWDADFLYVYAELEEPNVQARLTTRDGIVWHENDFEIFIDPDGDGRNYFEFEFNATNTVFDLFLTAPYGAAGGNCVLHQWNADGLRSAVQVRGTLNESGDRDAGWCLEVAVPREAIADGFTNFLTAGQTMRIGFSRVEWVDGRDRNWTWGATGEVNMHKPERWGRVTLAKAPFAVSVWYGWEPGESAEELSAKFVDWRRKGVTGVCLGVGGFDVARHREAAKRAKAAGLDYQAWVTTLLREGAPRSWYAVNKLGESAADKGCRAYVEYYATLDPHNPEVVRQLCEDCARLAEIDELDAVQLDYIRYADAILAKGLWGKYADRLDPQDYPRADYCYCEACRADFETHGEGRTWEQFRCDTLTACVNAICEAVHRRGKKVSVDVFPGPADYAIPMVRQEWNKWNADEFFAMNYNAFYLEDAAWIPKISRLERAALGSRGALHSGVMVSKDWLSCRTNPDPEGRGLLPSELGEVARGLKASGLDGLSIFTPKGLSAAHWAALGTALEGGSDELPWEGTFSDELRREWIEPDTVIDEERDDWRDLFRSIFRPLVADCKTPIEAVQRINSAIWDLLDVHYSTARDKANQSPFHSMRIHKASCTGMAILQICAFRAVGIPARLVGCNWTTIQGNHSWVEFHDGADWHFFGDGDPSPIDACWITPYAAAADAARPDLRIYASRATPNAGKTRFWRTWAFPQGFSDVWADDVTARYRRYADAEKAGSIDAIPDDTNYQKHQGRVKP